MGENIISGIEFWCVVLKPGEKQCIRSAHKMDLIHVTMACVSSEKAKGRTTVICAANQSAGPICVLTKKYQNQNLSLVLPGGENIMLEAKGEDSISITGFLQPMLPVEGDPISRLHRWDAEIEETFAKMDEAQAADNVPRRFGENEEVLVAIEDGNWVPAVVSATNVRCPGVENLVAYLVKKAPGHGTGEFCLIEDDSDFVIRKNDGSNPVTVVIPIVVDSQAKISPQPPKASEKKESSPTTPEKDSSKAKKKKVNTAKRKRALDTTPPTAKRKRSWNESSTGVKWKREPSTKSKTDCAPQQNGFRYVVQKNGETVQCKVQGPCKEKVAGQFSFLSDFRKFQETLQTLHIRKRNKYTMKYTEQNGSELNKYRCILEAA